MGDGVPLRMMEELLIGWATAIAVAAGIVL